MQQNENSFARGQVAAAWAGSQCNDSLQDSGSMINEELPTLTGASSHPLLPPGR